MRVVLQRSKDARVVVDGSIVGEIQHGFVVLLGVGHGDTEAEADWLLEKTSKLRVFADDDGRFNRSLLDVGGELLVISQFTLFADTTKGNRPSFIGAAPPVDAERLYEYFCDEGRKMGLAVQRGVFGAHMDVSLTNDGPVTVTLERTPPKNMSR